MKTMQKGCEYYARFGRLSAGFTYAHFQNHIIGADPLVLEGAGEGGSDLSLAAPWEFIEENHLPGRYGLVPDDSKELNAHLERCQSDGCRDTYGLIGRVSEVFSGKAKSMEPLLLASVFQSRSGYQPLVLRKETGFGEQISLLAPILRVFSDYRQEFAWPGEGRLRFSGYCRITYKPGSEEALFSDNRDHRMSMPFSKIRKIRSEDRDIWRNPELYFVHLSHENEKTFDGFGMVDLELREDMPEAENFSQRISADFASPLKRQNSK